jgi:hypothetical protein
MTETFPQSPNMMLNCPQRSTLDESLGQARQGHDPQNSPGYEVQAEHCAANYQ